MKNHIQIIVLLFMVSLKSYGINYYVNGNTGNNAKDGKSVINAKKDFTFCSRNPTALSPGDTVFVMNGTYTTVNNNSVLDLNCIGTSAKPIVFTNYQNHKPVFKYTGEPYHLIGLTWDAVTAYVVINGLTLEGNSVYSEAEIALAKNQTGNCLNGTTTQAKVKKYNVDGIGFYSRLDAAVPANEKISHHITISNCEIHNFPGGGIATSALDYLTIENCKVYNNGWYCVDGNSGISVLQCKNTDNHTSVEFSIIVRNNITYNNINYLPWSNAPNCVFTDGNGIIIDHLTQFAYNGKILVENNLSYDNGGGGIQFFKSENGVIRNNTLYRNGKQDGYANARGYRSGEFSMYNSTNVYFYNNIVCPIPGKVAVTSGSADATKICENNLIASNISGGFVFDGSKNILNQDPQFVDEANGDFRLKCTSPAIDAGTNVVGLFSPFDMMGSKRPNGTKPDIGAYEGCGPIGPDGFVYVSGEKANITITGTKDIAYGAGNSFVYLYNQTADVRCNTATFKTDPAAGVVKSCFIRESRKPYLGTAITIPGTIEAENYDIGGQNFTYYDIDPQNTGGVYRTDGVDIANGNGGKVVGWNAIGEWLEYSINVSKSASYDFEFFVASPNGTGKIGVDVDGVPLLINLVTPITASWASYTSFVKSANLTSGKHILRVNIQNAGFNLDKIVMKASTVTSIEDASSSNAIQVFPNPSKNGVFHLSGSNNWQVYTPSGQLIQSGLSDEINLGTEVKGLFILRVDGKAEKLMLE